MADKKWLHHLIAIFSFLIVSILFCRPVLEGKLLIASDNYQTIGSLKEADDYIKEHKVSDVGWTGTMFSGMPIFRGSSPNKMVSMVYALQQGEHAHSYDVLLWLMLSFYIFAIALGLSPWIATFIAIAFAFTGFNIMSMEHGHFFKIFAFAMIPGTLGGVILLLRKKYLAGAIVFGLFINLLVGINHTQITYYGMILAGITGLYFLVERVLKEGVKPLLPAIGIMAAGLALAVVCNISVFQNMQRATETTRGGQSELSAKQGEGSGLDKDYASSWSMDIVEAFTYFIPNFAGGPSSNAFVSDRNSNTYKAMMRNRDADLNSLAQQTSAYWGNQPFVGGGFYMGAGLCFLFALFFFISKDPRRIWIGISFFVILFFALGKNFPAFYSLVFDHLPMYNKFRVPSMMNLLMQAIIAIGAALCLNALLTEKIDKKKVYIAAGSIVAVTAVFVLASPYFFSFTSRALAEAGTELPGWLESALRKDRIALMQKDGIRSVVIMALCAGMIWLYFEKKLPRQAALIVGIGVICCFDVIGNASRHISADDFQSRRKAYSIFNPSAADAQILADPDPHFRVFNLTRSPFNDAITSYHHKSIGGYHGAKLRRYQELIEYQISRNNRGVLDMLNTKYFIVNGSNGPEARRNPTAAGNAWLVDSLVVVPDGDAEMNALNEPFKPTEYAVVQEKYLPAGTPLQYQVQPGDEIVLTEYSPDRMTYRYKGASNSFAVFSEIFYQLEDGTGWHAYIDGEETGIVKVNFLLRGLSLPAGEHEIVFEFNKEKLLRLSKVRKVSSILTILLLLSLTGWLGYREFKPGGKPEEAGQ